MEKWISTIHFWSNGYVPAVRRCRYVETPLLHDGAQALLRCSGDRKRCGDEEDKAAVSRPSSGHQLLQVFPVHLNLRDIEELLFEGGRQLRNHPPLVQQNWRVHCKSRQGGSSSQTGSDLASGRGVRDAARRALSVVGSISGRWRTRRPASEASIYVKVVCPGSAGLDFRSTSLPAFASLATRLSEVASVAIGHRTSNMCGGIPAIEVVGHLFRILSIELFLNCPCFAICGDIAI